MTATIDIRDDEINVEDIMRQIRANIQKRKISSGYVEIESLIKEPLQENSKMSLTGNLKQNMDYVNANWDIHADYNSNYISSHRPLIGELLVRGRRLVHEEVRRYVDVVFDKQTEFNMSLVCILNELIRNIKYSNEAYLFPKEIVERSFLDIFRNCKNVLNIGAQGEFLLMLNENGIYGKSINPEEERIKEQPNKGTDVQLAHPIAYLKSITNDSLDGIFIGHTIEFLQSKELIDLITLSLEKLKQSSYFVAEITDDKIHPEVMKFLMEHAGFTDIQLKFFYFSETGATEPGVSQGYAVHGKKPN